jgi:hypothetical protein
MCNKLNYIIYDINIYKLFLLEFLHYLNKERNHVIRKQIKKIILKDINTNICSVCKQIETLLGDDTDIIKIKEYISEYSNNRDKNKLLDNIDKGFFNFDKILFGKLIKLSYKKIYDELIKLSYKLVIFKDISNLKTFHFTNIYYSCTDKSNINSYCSNHKLIINKKQLERVLKIMTSDILNPVKQKWLFSGILDENYINIFKFIKRDNETITIEI